MSFISLLRLTVLFSVLVFSVIVLGLSAHLTFLTTEFLGGYFAFAALAIATASLTIITLPVMIGIDLARRGAFTSMVVVELAWLCVLWVLWLASAGLTAQDNLAFFPSGCGFINPDVDTACKEFSAIEAFAFLSWIILLGYTVTLLVFAIIGSIRGQRVWTSSVSETSFLARSAPGTTTAPGLEKPTTPYTEPPVSSSPVQYPPSQQSQWTGQPAGHSAMPTAAQV